MFQPPADLLPEHRGYRAVEGLYHSLLTGTILAAVGRCEADAAEDLVFRTFRNQQEALFLPGLAKLGLDGLPHAVACAQYHYLSNAMGGVKVAYARESDRKAWVCYPPPRWIWAGTAACAVPGRVSAAMLHAWHGNNGVLLGNPRLGFVCVGQTVEGHPGLEGYYLEHDRPLEPAERLRFAPNEAPPRYDPAAMPRPPAVDWPAERLRKAMRNYAMAYVRSLLPQLSAALGPRRGPRIGALAARIVGMQGYDDAAALLGVKGDAPEDFAQMLTDLLTAQGERATQGLQGGTPTVRMEGWRLFADESTAIDAAAQVFPVWNALWEGLLAVHNRRLRLTLTRPLRTAADTVAWSIEG